VGSITGHGETAARAVHFPQLKSRSRPTPSFSASQGDDDVDDADKVSRLPHFHCGIYKFVFEFSDNLIYQSFLHLFNLSISHYLIVFN